MAKAILMDKKNKELTINEVARKYVVSYSTVYKYCRAGKIQGAIQIVFDNKKRRGGSRQRKLKEYLAQKPTMRRSNRTLLVISGQ